LITRSSGHSTPKVREINIRAQVENGQVAVEVSDTGVGIKTQDKERIFQSHYSTKGAGGAGMGLYLVKQIIHAHSGTIEVLSKTGPGATFQIRLPTSS
jgi:signal transduction histidine kinase